MSSVALIAVIVMPDCLGNHCIVFVFVFVVIVIVIVVFGLASLSTRSGLSMSGIVLTECPLA